MVSVACVTVWGIDDAHMHMHVLRGCAAEVCVTVLCGVALAEVV